MPERTASILRHPNAARERIIPTRALPARIELNMRQLRAVLAVSQGGSVHKAASLLHVTQPAVTRAIHELEQALGLELFERTPKGMVATQIGAIRCWAASPAASSSVHCLWRAHCWCRGQSRA
jgi:LysR family transcriptional regulator, regulator for genes of the gallate degradation pathway